MFLRRLLLALFVLFSAAANARADDYADVTWPNLVRTLVRFKAIDLTEPVFLNEYSIITECDLYKHFYRDDFKWNQVLQAVRKSVEMNIATFPLSYQYSIKLQLDRYNFEQKMFEFTNKSKLENANSFKILVADYQSCGSGDIKVMPRTFHIVITEPIFLQGLPLSEKEAQALLERMNAGGDTNRIIYGRLNLRIVYINPLQKSMNLSGNPGDVKYEQTNVRELSGVRLDARLNSIDFYEDKDMTREIYKYEQ